MLRRGQLGLQRRQQRQILFQLALGRNPRRGGRAAERIGLAHQLDVVVVGLDHAVQGRQLRAQGRDGHRLQGDVRGQGQIGRLGPASLRLGPRAGRLDAAAVAPEQVQVVADRPAHRVEAEGGVGERHPAEAGEAEGLEVGALAVGAGVQAGLGPRLTPRLGQGRTGLTQGRVGLGQGRTVFQRLADDGVQRRRSQRQPPGPSRGRGRVQPRLARHGFTPRRVAGRSRRGRTSEVGPHRRATTGQPGQAHGGEQHLAAVNRQRHGSSRSSRPAWACA